MGMKRIQVAQKKQAKVQPANAPDQRESDHEPTATLQPPTLQLKSSAPVQLRALSDRQVQVIANNVKEAVKGWGTDEEAIFQNLQRLQRDAEDIAELKKEYKARFSVDIETDLRDDLSGDELRLALSLITPKADKKGPETNMVAGETDQNNFDSQAERLRNAMEGIGTNEAEVYAVLSPYEGDYLKLSKLKTAYFNKTGRSLSTDVDDEFSGDEKKFALRLLNGAYPEADGDIMGAYHSERAEKRFASLGIFENIQFCIQLILAKNYQERQWLFKALAANRTIDEIQTFAGRIRGQTREWMQDHLRLTGSTFDSGIQQQWSHSCNATSVQAVRGEADPIYALEIHDNNPNPYTANNASGTAANPSMAGDQKTMLESTYSGGASGAHKGVSASRSNIAAGSGRWADDLLNKQSTQTGLGYSTKKIGSGFSVGDAIDAINAGVERGNPVPIVIGGTSTSYTHYVVVTQIDKGTTPHTYRIHDPWNGVTVTRSVDDLKNGTINLANSNIISAVEVPTENH